MYIKLKHTYFTVCRTANSWIDILIRTWRGLMYLLKTIKKIMDAIGYRIVWLISTVFLFLKYALIFTSTISFLVFFIGGILGFKMPLYLAMFSVFGFVILFFVWLGSGLSRVPYDDY